MRQFTLQWLADTIAMAVTLFLLPAVDVAVSYPLAGLWLALGWASYAGMSPLIHRIVTYAVLGLIYALLDRYVKPALIVATGRLILTSMGFWLVALNVVVFGVFLWLSPFEVTCGAEATLLLTVGTALLFTVVEGVTRLVLGVDQPRPISEQENDRYWRLVERFSGGRRNTIVENLRIRQVHDILINFAEIIVLKRVGWLSRFRARIYQFMYGQPDPLMTKGVPEIVRIMLEFLGPTWVKFGQIASSQAEALPEEWRIQMAKLQSQASPFPWAEAEKVITEELGRPISELFTSIEHTPWPLPPRLKCIGRSSTAESRWS